MFNRIVLSVALLGLVVSSGFGTDRNQVGAHPAGIKATPTVPGVVYVQFREGSAMLRHLNGKSMKIQSPGTSKLQSVLNGLKTLEVVPFDDKAPNDQITHDLGIDRMYVVYYSDLTIDPHAAGALLLSSGEIEKVSARYAFPISRTPNDPDLGNEYALGTMKITQAWDMTTGDTSVVIADVDCAINIDHEDLKDVVKINWGETGLDKDGKDKRTNGKDDDGDGVVDDWTGVDVVGGPNRGTNSFIKDGDPRPDDPSMSHGTETAGCIIAAGDNGKGIAGVAYGCRLMPIKASDNAQNITGGYEGIHWAVTHGARIVNCSWGGPVTSGEIDFANTFLREASSRNALVVAAAGNSGVSNDKNINFPSNGIGVLSVGASDVADGAASFSDFGSSVCVWAPGVSIYSTSYPGDNSYAYVDGTSFASPLTAGVAGLIASMHPNWPPKFILRQIMATSENVINGGNDPVNYRGRVNAQVALQSLPSTPGVLAQSYSINGVKSDSLGFAGQPLTISVDFKNYLNGSTGLSAKLLAPYGATADPTPTPLGDLATGATTSGTFHLTRPAIYSQGTLPLWFALSDTRGYVDTVQVFIPMKQSVGFSTETQTPYGSAIKRVTNYDCWAAYGIDQSGSTFSGYAIESGGAWLPVQSFGTGALPVYCVDALDDQTAWFGTGSSTSGSGTTVYSTSDGGSNWNPANVYVLTPFVNTIHFFDAQNGILIGDPKNLRWGILTSVDGGVTWKALSTKVAAASGEASWNNSAAWVGKVGLFGTNNSRIWRTTDKGVSWKPTTTPFQHSLAIALDDDTLHGIACFRPTLSATTQTVTGKSGLAVTSDAGLSWKSIKMPDDSMMPGTVKFVPASHIAIVTSDRGTFETTDFGATWKPVGVPLPMISDINDISISVEDSTFTASVMTAGSGIATYTDQYSPIAKPAGPAAVGSTNAEADRAITITSSPNPFVNSSVITFDLPARESIRLIISDELGRQIAVLASGNMTAGTHSVEFDAHGLSAGVYYCTLVTDSGIRISRALSVVR